MNFTLTHQHAWQRQQAPLFRLGLPQRALAVALAGFATLAIATGIARLAASEPPPVSLAGSVCCMNPCGLEFWFPCAG